jgi:hypothetical protein
MIKTDREDYHFKTKEWYDNIEKRIKKLEDALNNHE